MEIPNFVTLFQTQLPLVGKIFAVLWGTFFLNKLLGDRLNLLGIYPRKWYGIPGIVCSPFLHGNFTHLLFNSIPLFILINFILLQGESVFFHITLLIVLMTGVSCWLFGRAACHIGASGIVMGYFSYLLMNAYQQPSLVNVVLGGLCLYYLGGLFSSLIPTDKTVSWEGHVFGFLSGIIANFLQKL